ncbi:MAG: MFS transporter [Acidobacteria bacterium]|nr:MFS transporter [Acidobacteriota bacterium]
MQKRSRIFYGWYIVAAAAVTYGIAQGIPYYNVSFFYDYFQRSFGWSRSQITLGFPLAALLTIWVGPAVVPKFSQRKLILFGTVSTAASLAGFAWMNGSIAVYFALWALYTIGYLTSGPIPHQLIISHWFGRRRGTAMGILYFGVGVVGALGSYIVKPLTEAHGYRVALLVLAAIMFAGWPLVLFVLRDKPSDCGLAMDGEIVRVSTQAALSPAILIRRRAFWLLLLGSVCSIASVGAISQHMKFIFLDSGFTKGAQLDAAWRTASILILVSSTAGRLLVGVLADWLSTRAVMIGSYVLTALTVIPLLTLQPPHVPYLFAIAFGIAMGADYMLIPLMLAEEFGIETLACALSIILPLNTIAQTWFPYFVSVLREHSSSYRSALLSVVTVAAIGAVAIIALPRRRGEFRA